MNFILFLVKLYVAVSSNSISIYVDSLNSLADTFVCIIAVIGFKISTLPPNEKHPFGYGRTEDLINFCLSVIILLTGAVFAYTSLQRLMYPVPVWFASKYAITIGTTALAKLLMAFYFKQMNKKAHSPVIKNLGVDSVLDFFVSACIVISFTLTVYFGYAIDAVTGIVVSVFIIISGVKSLITTCSILIGRRDDEECEQVKKTIMENSQVTLLGNIQCHKYGETKVFTVTITADCETAQQLTELLETLTAQIEEKYSSQLYITFGRKSK